MLTLFFTGACFASFFALLGWRLPQKKSVIFVRSVCDHCQHPLVFFDLIPVLSFLFLRGRCRYCQEAIAPFHFIAKCLGGILFVLCLYLLEPSPYLILLSFASIAFFISDIFFYQLPDFIMVGLLIGTAILHYFYQAEDFLHYIVCGSVCFFILWVFFQVTKGKIGGGDVKLIGTLAFLAGYPRILWVLVLASTLGLLTFLFLPRLRQLPFGPYLLTAAWLVLVFY